MTYLLVGCIGALVGMIAGCLIAARYEQQQEAERVAVRRRYGVAR